MLARLVPYAVQRMRCDLVWERLVAGVGAATIGSAALESVRGRLESKALVVLLSLVLLF